MLPWMVLLHAPYRLHTRLWFGVHGYILLEILGSPEVGGVWYSHLRDYSIAILLLF